jgi:hypothetical protein
MKEMIMHSQFSMRRRYSRTVTHDIGGNAAIRAPPQRQISLGLHACACCGVMTSHTWFCVECDDRACPHRDDDPYDEIGGEGDG